MSRFDQIFTAVAAPVIVAELGELVVFDPGDGPKRSIMMTLERDVQGVDHSGSPVYVTVGKCQRSMTSVDDNGHGGIDSTEVVYGRARIEYPLRVGSAVKTSKMIRRISDDGSGMLAVEVS